MPQTLAIPSKLFGKESQGMENAVLFGGILVFGLIGNRGFWVGSRTGIPRDIRRGEYILVN